MWNWIKTNTDALQAIAGLLTVLVAVLALLGVKYQVEHTDRIQKEQAAKEIYREFLSLSVQNAKLASIDYCAEPNKSIKLAYENYVEYLLYTAEHMISIDEDWNTTLLQSMSQHDQYLCNREDWDGYTDKVLNLINRFQDNACQEVQACNE